MRISTWFYKLSYLWLGRLMALVIATSFFVPSEAMASFSTTMHSFSLLNSSAGLTMGSDGNLYGTNNSEGANTLYGSVFKITPSGTYTVLHSFSSSDPAGANPTVPPILGIDGNIYGTTSPTPVSPASIFKVTPAGALTIAYSFSSNLYPNAIVQGIDGSFYGIAGTGAYYEIFKVTPSGAFSVLHVFSSHIDGCGNALPLIRGSDGNFYGAMSNCGLPDTTVGGVVQTNGKGTIYQITPNGVFTKLYTFLGGTDGLNPSSALVQGNDGNFYGTTNGWLTAGGSITGLGTDFKITPAGSLTTLSILQSSPSSPLVQASDGNFYGATSGGIYTITPSGTFTNIFAFLSYSAPSGLPAQSIPYIAGPAGTIVVSSDLKSIYGAGTSGGDSSYPYGGIYRVSIGASTGADLSISSASGTETSTGVSTFNLTVSNAGPETATGTSICALMPTGSTSFVASNGICQGYYANYSVGTIAAGSSVTISIRSQTTPAAVISPTFQALSDVSDPNLNNNVVGITVSPQIDSLSINGSYDSQTPSGLQHNLTITNAGPGIATHVVVSATLPAGASLVTSASNSGCLQSGLQLTCSIGTINVGATAKLVITILNDPDPIIFTVTSDQTNLNTGGNTYQDYPPGYDNDTPTIPQWGAILMGLLLMFVSAKRSRRQN